MKIKNVVIISVALLFSATTFAGSKKTVALEALSAWTNTLGSTLYIDTIEGNGLMTGTYINRAQGYGCQDVAYPVIGWIYGSAITFTTKWESATESCNSITSWTGFYTDGQIRTLWQLTINGSTRVSQIRQGSDVFTPTTGTSNKSLIIKK